MSTNEQRTPGKLAVDLTVLRAPDGPCRPGPNVSRSRFVSPVHWWHPWNPLVTGWASRPSRMHAYAWIAIHRRWFEHHLEPARDVEPEGTVFVDEPWLVVTAFVVVRYESLAAAVDAIDGGHHERAVERFEGKGSRVDLMSRAYQGGLPGLGRRR